MGPPPGDSCCEAAGNAAAAAGGGDEFRALVAQLVEVHQREVTQLRADLDELRRGGGCAATRVAEGSGGSGAGDRGGRAGEEGEDQADKSAPVVAATTSAQYPLVALPSIPASSKTSDTLVAAAAPVELAGMVAQLPSHRSSEVEGIGSWRSHSVRGAQRCPLLPAQWPENVELRDDLRPPESAESSPRYRRSVALDQIFKLKRSRGRTEKRLLIAKGGQDHPRRLQALDPNSMVRTVHDIMSILILLHDVLVIPFVVAWQVPIEGWLLGVACVVMLFWSWDLVINFMTGFYVKGDLHLDLKEAAWHYLGSRFVLDLFMVVTDWISMALLMAQVDVSDDSSAVKLARIAKMGRLLRIFGVLRITRYVALLKSILLKTFANSENLAMKVLQLCLCVLFFNHLACCAWFQIGYEAPSDSSARWLDYPVTFHEGEERSFHNAGTLYQYLTAYHWTMVHIASGETNLEPSNTWERIFSVSLLMVGLLFSSTVVSLFSAQTVQLMTSRRLQTEQLEVASNFVQQHKIGAKLRVRIQRQLVERVAKKKPLAESDVPAFRLLSSALLTELMCATRMPCLDKHPFFAIWHDLDVAATEELCCHVIDFVFLARGDRLFRPGGDADAAFHLFEGDATYAQHPSSSCVGAETVTAVEDGRWICEAALWSRWVYVGEFDAASDCKILTMPALKLFRVMDKHEVLKDITREYGCAFHERIISAVPPHAPWPSDLFVPFTDTSDLLSGDLALGFLRNSSLQGRDKSSLEAEIRTGRSSIQVASQGNLERIVNVEVLRLKRRDGRILAQLGEGGCGKPVLPGPRLPGTKRERGELPKNALGRLLEQLFGPAAGNAVVAMGIERDVQVMESRSYSGVISKYLRNTHNMVASSAHAEPMIHRAAIRRPLDAQPMAGGPQADDGGAAGIEELIAQDRGDREVYFAWVEPLTLEQFFVDAEEELGAWLAEAVKWPDNDTLLEI